MYELLEAFDVAVMKELFLEVRFPRAGFGGGTLWRCHRHIASRGHLELAVNHWGKLSPGLGWGRSRNRFGGKFPFPNLCSQNRKDSQQTQRNPAWSDNRKHPWDSAAD